MRIHVEYFGLSRVASGVARETLELPAACPLAQALAVIGARHAPLGAMLTPDLPAARSSVLLFVDDEPQSPGSDRALSEEQTILLLSPMSGG